MNRKSTLFLILFALASINVFSSENEASWKILEQAQVKFDSGNYGESLNLANNALSNRKEEVRSEYRILEDAVTPAQVRKAGNDLNDVIPVLEEREQKTALKIIDKYLKLFGKDFFNNDIKVLLSWLKNKDVFPEADYLIGRIYQMEGEFQTALTFYSKAWQEKAYLDISDVQFDILYSMAFLYNINNDDEQVEKTLLLVLDNDEAFKNELLRDSIVRTVNQDKAENVDRFFMLYRAEAGYSLRALFELSNLYDKRGDSKNALICSALGAVEAFTHIFAAISERDSRFKYTTYSAFLNECAKYEEIVEWGKNKNVWETMFLFADRSAKVGKLVFARNLYLSLANSLPDTYYKALASERLK
jgi:tetratricopeptide (TPR) repeat protein